METLKPQSGAAAMRLHVAYQLQRRYAISVQDMAQLLRIPAQIYQKRLKKAGFEPKNTALPALNIEDILMKINAELQRFSQNTGLPDKAAVDALASLAKAVKSIHELAKETRTDRVETDREAHTEQGGVKPEELREALNLICRRINEFRNHSGAAY